MLIERDIGPLSVAPDETIEHALRQITLNRRRVVFCVGESGLLVGIITDGDFRRWLLENPGASLTTPASTVANRSLVSAPFGSTSQIVDPLFSQSITCVPLVDERGRLVAVARPHTRGFWIDGKTLGDDSPTFIVAEIGINHNGSLATAKQLVELAASAGADSAKFQMRDMSSLYRNAGATGDHREDLGPQYTLDLLDRFSLRTEEMIEAFDYCRRVGITPLCTPWDLASAEVLDDYGIPGFKVASADLTNHDLLTFLAQTARPIIMSTGMSTEEEIVESTGILRSAGAPFALLHCNSTYPAPFKDVNLRYLERLAVLGDCVVGYSGHERGHHIPVAAVGMGAKIIEKHITLDRTWEGNDHKVSLEPTELVAMVREIRELESALGTDVTRKLTQGELMNRVNLAKSIVARVEISKDAQITESMLDIRSPGRGLQPNRRGDLIGRRARRSLSAGDFFFPSDLDDSAVVARDYAFNRRWGLPVRYHDYKELADLSNPDFIEFHMSYRDLDLRVDDMVPDRVELGLVVHSPDLFPGDHILNLAAEDNDYWKRSIQELQRVVDLTRELAPRFRVDAPPLIVASLGGFSSNAPLPTVELPRMYERVTAGLNAVESEGVEIIPQTLPPFPWYLGGQLFCNLFVGPDDTAAFSRDHGVRLCLDIAHTKLACNHRRLAFSEAIEVLAPVAAHLHIVDAGGLDDEGLQIDEGEVDFHILGEQLKRLAPTASFIPEIWQGHQNVGEGFWIALDASRNIYECPIVGTDRCVDLHIGRMPLDSEQNAGNKEAQGLVQGEKQEAIADLKLKAALARRRVGTMVLGNASARRVATGAFQSGLVALGEQNHYSFPRRWVTVDRRDADLKMVLGPKSELPFPDDSQRIVYAAHILEHLDDATIMGLLSEVHRVLRTGGGVRIEVPDAGFLLDSWKNRDEYVLGYFRRYRQKVVIDRFGFDKRYIEDHLTPLGEISNYLIEDCHIPVYAAPADFEENAAAGLEQLNVWAQSLKTEQQANTPGHRNALTFDKLESIFKCAGFSRVFKVQKGHSRIDGLRLGSNVRAIWDSIVEKPYRAFYSLYVDAVKD